MLAGPARHLLLSTASVMVLALLGASSYAQAQQVVANGTTQTASGTINTGVLPPTAGYDLYSLNGGVIQSFSPFTLRTGGAGSHAVAAESGGAITIFSGSSVTTTGTNATGLAATGANSTITAANLTLSATSVGSFGAAATDGALISLTGGTITSTSSALRVANGGNINATNLNLTATVGGAIGVNADNGTITLTGGTVTAIVGSTAGINASGANGLVNANSVNVNASSNGVQAVTGATLTFSNGTIAGTAIGVRASSGGTTSVDSSTINLAAAGTRGALAKSGSTVNINGSTIRTTATTTANSAGQVGVRATGAAGTMNVTGSSITMGPPNGTTVANNMTGATADGGAALSLTNTPIQMLGGLTGVGNHGLVVTGASSTAGFVGGSIATRSRGSFGAWAQDGGVISLSDLAQISTTGAATVGTLIGSHALYASGANSIINATNVTATTSGTLANGVRADAGGAANLTNVQVTTTGNGTATTGGSHGLYALGAGSQITGNNVTANISGTFASAARAEGGTISLTNSNLTTSGIRGRHRSDLRGACDVRRRTPDQRQHAHRNGATGNGVLGAGCGLARDRFGFDRFGGRKPRKRGFHLQWRPGHRYQQHADVDRL